MRIRILGNVESGYNKLVAGNICDMKDNDAEALIKCKMAELCEEKIIEPQEQKEETIDDIETPKQEIAKTPKKRNRRKKIEVTE
jgi:hypothetical protein